MRTDHENREEACKGKWDRNGTHNVGMPVIEALEAPLLRLGLFLRNGLSCDVCLWP